MKKIIIFNTLFLIVVSLFVIQILPRQFNPIEVKMAIQEKFDLFARGVKEKNIDLAMQIFAPHVIGMSRTVSDRSYHTIKDGLAMDFAEENLVYEYMYQIKELVITNDIAMVRVIWTLKTTDILTNTTTYTDEVAMDIFKYINGQWLLVRFIAYSVPIE